MTPFPGLYSRFENASYSGIVTPCVFTNFQADLVVEIFTIWLASKDASRTEGAFPMDLCLRPLLDAAYET